MADFKKEMADAKTFQERMAVVRKQALEASQAAAAKAAKEAEGPKRKLNRIPNKVHVAKVDKVVNLDEKGKSGGKDDGHGKDNKGQPC